MVTYSLNNIKTLSRVLALGLILSSSLQAQNDPFSIDLEGPNLIGPKTFKRYQQPKYDWIKNEPKDSSQLSSPVRLYPKILNPIPSSK